MHSAPFRYIYSKHKTREGAERALEEFFATGEVSEGERPRVERVGSRFYVTLEGS
jgi:hypothetical protein